MKLKIKEYNSSSGGLHYYSKNFNHRVDFPFIHNEIKKGVDLEVENFDEYKLLMNVLKLAQTDFKRRNLFLSGDTQLMNRIIRGGGLIKYIKSLEVKLNGDL